MLAKQQGNLEFLCSGGGMQNGAVAKENSMAIPQKIKNRITM